MWISEKKAFYSYLLNSHIFLDTRAKLPGNGVQGGIRRSNTATGPWCPQAQASVGTAQALAEEQK